MLRSPPIFHNAPFRELRSADVREAIASPDHDVSGRGGDVGPHRHLEDQTDHSLFFCHPSSPVGNTTLTLLGRFAARAGFVALRRTFVRRCQNCVA
jgi:hypothetical protein